MQAQAYEERNRSQLSPAAPSTVAAFLVARQQQADAAEAAGAAAKEGERAERGQVQQGPAVGGDVSVSSGDDWSAIEQLSPEPAIKTADA